MICQWWPCEHCSIGKMVSVVASRKAMNHTYYIALGLPETATQADIERRRLEMIAATWCLRNQPLVFIV